MFWFVRAVVVGVAVGAATALPPGAAAQSGATIALDANVRHQMWHGFEFAVLSTTTDYDGITADQWNEIFDQYVRLGINRVRLSIQSGVEGPQDIGYKIVNDNRNSNVINPDGFSWRTFDWEIEHLVAPWRQKVIAAGMPVFVCLQYTGGGAPHDDPSEYAEFILAVFQHMQSKYGFVPDGVDTINEPDNNGWNPTQVGRATVAAGRRLKAAGFTPEFTAPSTASTSNGPPYIAGMMAVSGVAQLVKEFSYHRYGESVEDVRQIARLAVQHGKRTAMLEKWAEGSLDLTLAQDLDDGRNSAWQQGVSDIFGCKTSQLLAVVNGQVQLCPITKLTAQTMRYLRPGAQRIGATTTNAAFDPVAFINTDGRWLVVVSTEGVSGSFSVTGLPAGTYALTYTERGGPRATTTLPDVTVAVGQALSTSFPTDGVFSIVSKKAGRP